MVTAMDRPVTHVAATARDASILDQTLAAATRDAQTVTPEGKPLAPLIEGIKIREVRTHCDARGSVVEIFDKRWGWHSAPVSSLHCFTVRPGFVKGWSLHEHHEDRYMILQGEMELVLFDPRPNSSTYGKVGKILMSERHRCLVNIPAYVWHADQNIGVTDVVVIDMPTAPYNHENPDKWRLPIDTPLIPYSFGNARGW
jgi:dTDP-4-dehydrorhamnose 3,5-epimerase